MLTAERRAEIDNDISILKAVQDHAYYKLRTTSSPENGAVSALLAAWVSVVSEMREQDLDYVDERPLMHVPPGLAEYIGEKFTRVFGGTVVHNRSDSGHLAHMRFVRAASILLPGHIRSAIFVVEKAIRAAAQEQTLAKAVAQLETALDVLDHLRAAFTPRPPAAASPIEPELTAAMLDRAVLAARAYGLNGIVGWTDTHTRQLAKDVILAAASAKEEEAP